MTTSAWSNISSHPNPEGLRIATGSDKDNYIVIHQNSIWKYDLEHDKWNKIIHISHYLASFHPAAFDKNKNELYIYTDAQKLIKIHLKNKTCGAVDAPSCGVHPECLIIDDTLNVIGDDSNHFHKQWNSEKKKFTKDIIMYDKAHLSGFGMIYTDQPKKHLLLFGGYDYNKKKYSNYILDFDFKQKNWNKIATKMPKELWCLSCTLAIRNKYVLIFGGSYSGMWSNDIYIYSMRNKTIRKSSIECPSDNDDTFQAITINNELKDEMIVFGFVRNSWKTSNIKHYFPPQYLLKLMHAYYLTEHICLLDIETGNHWKINSLDIFS